MADLWTVPAIYAIEAATTIPPGALLVGALLPAPGHRAARCALTGATGYVASTLLAVLLGTVGYLSLYPFISLALACAWALRALRRVRRDEDRWETLRQGVRQAPWPLVAIGICSLLAVRPLLMPVHEAADGGVISYAYIDNYQSLAFLQALMRHIPLTEHHSLAGILPRVYPDYHYVHLAMLARLSGATATDIYFVHGPVLALLLGLVTTYATGRELTGTRSGGYVGAALVCLAVVPNPYDLNLALASVPVPFMPTVYQSHFFSPRYNLHEGAGVLVLTAAALALWLSQASEDRRSRIGSFILSGCFVAALSRVRSQHLLAAAPAFFAVTGWLAVVRRERQALFGPVAFGALFAVLAAQSLLWPYDTRATNLHVDYGAFGWELLDRWHLPARLQGSVASLPRVIAPAVAVVTYVLFRLVGLNLGVLIAGRATALARVRRLPNVFEVFCILTLAAGIIAALTLRRDAITLGMQIVQASHALATLLAITPAALVVSAIARGCGSAWQRWGFGISVLALLTFVGSRAASAALHDQEPRAYTISAPELAAYRWIQSSTPPDAVVAAHPDHHVNAAGETIRTTNVLTAMTDRRTYISRAGVDEQTLSRSRSELLRSLFQSEADSACDLATALPVDFLLEFADRPLAARGAPCFSVVFSQSGVTVYRVVRSAFSASPQRPEG